MKIVSATLFALKLPFVEAFAHSVRDRTYSDSIVVRVEAADGTVGYGETVARPYVTGETVDSCLAFMVNTLWPAVQRQDYPKAPAGAADGLDWLNSIAATLSHSVSGQPDSHRNRQGAGSGGLAEENKGTDVPVIAWNAAKAGWELALVDCLLKSEGRSLAHLLPPKRSTVTYSGVITACRLDQAVKIAKRFRQFGISHLKVKTTGTDDRARVAAIRSAVGAAPSLRLDGNSAYTLDAAIATCQDLAELGIDSAEQLIPRGDPTVLAQVQAATPIPQMADESLITLADAQALIEAQACQGFNLRLAKCGGLAQTIAIAQMAEAAGIHLQVGCQVGETAILSAAGRHLAAWLPQVRFVEGSYGKLLLRQDVSRTPVQFGYQGKAPVLKRPGLGVDVQDETLSAYAQQTLHLDPMPVSVSALN